MIVNVADDIENNSSRRDRYRIYESENYVGTAG
jgi:hypothetical protein